MELADPMLAALRIELDVGDAIQLQQDAPITLFLDSDPLTPHAAQLARIAYKSELTPAGIWLICWMVALPMHRRVLACAVLPSCPANTFRWRFICFVGRWL